MIGRCQFSLELFRRKQSDVYLAAKAAFKFSQDWEQIDPLQRSFDHQVYIAAGVLLSARNRSIFQGEFDSPAKFLNLQRSALEQSRRSSRPAL